MNIISHVMRNGIQALLVGIATLIPASSLWAQYSPPPQHVQQYSVTVGPVVDAPQVGETEGAMTPTRTELVEVPGAPWLQLRFGQSSLGERSYFLITSLEDGAQQRMDAATLALWHNASAYFNGEAVKIELYMADGETGIFIEIDSLIVGEREAPGVGIESLCGSDNRVASGDDRVGRINGCTAWLVSNGGVLTAGHCVDSDPDRDGPLLPDGVLDLAGTFSVNVPASDSDGTLNQSLPQDQYPINTTNVTWRYDGSGQGLGKDWAVFGVNPNTVNGDRAHITHGFFRMTRENPAYNLTFPPDWDIMRVTGFGVDDTPAGTTGGANAQNRTNQTNTGFYQGEASAGANIWHRYVVDTEPANSGSPVIWDTDSSGGGVPMGFTVGIHTNGGCDSGSNSGTSFEVDALETAITAFPGAGSEYVDAAPNPAPSEDGSVFRPWNTVAEGAAGVVSGGRVIIVEGSYAVPSGGIILGGKSMTLEAPVGTVTID